jgi:hypothetical protein
MDYPTDEPPMPVEYYRQHASRVRELASQATTSAIKQHLQDVVSQYERLADHVQRSASP